MADDIDDNEIEMPYETARLLKEQLGAFLSSDGWKFVATFLERRADGREKELLTIVPESVKQMVAYARLKGGIEELRLIAPMLAQVYMDVETSVLNMQDEFEENQGETL